MIKFKVSPIDFMAKRRFAGAISIGLVLVSITALAIKGLNFGLDFTGGTVLELQFEQGVKIEPIKQLLLEQGYPKSTVQYFGSSKDIIIRTAVDAQQSTQKKLAQILDAGLTTQKFIINRSEYIGPHIGAQLKEQGVLGLLLAFLVVMVYVAFRFQLKFSISAIAALIHDVLIVLGCFALFNWQFDLTVLAAILAIIGYSLNDSIVISDRIRENFRRLRKFGSANEVINISLNDVFGRTIITSITTLLVAVSLLVAGGESIHSFAQAMILGIVVGSYSSIYIVANLLLTMKIKKDNLVVSDAEKSLIDSRP